MKKFLLLSLSTLFFWRIESLAQETTQSHEQKNNAATTVETIKIEAEESKEKMSQGVQNCIKVYIPDAKQENVERDFEKFMKTYNAKGDEKKGEYFFDNAEIKSFGNNLVDVYSIAQQKAGGVELLVFFDLGGAFLNSTDHAEKYKEAVSIVKRFGHDEASTVIGLQMVTLQKMLDSKSKEFDNLVKQDSMLSRKIRECIATINQAQADQQINRTSQQTKKKELEDEQLMMQGLKTKQEGIE